MAQRWMALQAGPPREWVLEEFTPPAPSAGEVTIRIHASGVNPADYKHVAKGPLAEPVAVGYEVSGELIALGEDTRIASGGATIGDEVLAFRVRGGYATEVTVPAEKVFAKPANLTHPEAANLLLAGTTAAELLFRSGARSGDTVLMNGASGAVGVSLLQQARLLGITVIGTASERGAERVAQYGGIAVAYGPGLTDRVREAAPQGIVAAFDAAGTDEAIATSLELVADRSKVITIAAAARAKAEGFTAIAGSLPASAAFRDEARARLIALAAESKLEVPVWRTYPLADMVAALDALASGQAEGKIALVP